MIRQGVITLTASAQQFETALSLSEIGQRLRMVAVQPDAANSNVLYIGGAGVTTVNGIRLEAPSGGIPSAPFQLSELFGQGILLLSDFYTLGTVGEKLRVFWIPQI